MPLTENEIRNLLSLDDSRLRDVVMQICDAVGADRKKAEKFTSNPAGLRQTLSSMSADEINKLLDKAGRERSTDVLNSLRGRR